LLGAEPLPEVDLGPLAPADRLELLVVPPGVDVALDQDLLDLEDQPDDVVGELRVEPVLGDEVGPLAVCHLGG
jgi:hypothetical protein